MVAWERLHTIAAWPRLCLLKMQRPGRGRDYRGGGSISVAAPSEAHAISPSHGVFLAVLELDDVFYREFRAASRGPCGSPCGARNSSAFAGGTSGSVNNNAIAAQLDALSEAN